MYYKNISLHLAYLQTNKKKCFCKKKFAKFKKDSKIQSVLSFLRICVYILYSSSRCNAEKVIYNL